MRIRFRTITTLAAEALLTASFAPGQSPAVREIDDPSSGSRWRLLRNTNHPEGPGRLVLVTDKEAIDQRAVATAERQAGSNARKATTEEPVIHAGDDVIVEEHSAVVEARLEAIAMESAGQSTRFRARLKIGGRVVRATALGPKLAILGPANETKP